MNGPIRGRRLDVRTLRRRSRATRSGRKLEPGVIMAPLVSSRRDARVRATTIAEFDEGAFIENLAVDAYGDLFVTNHPTGRIEHFDAAYTASTHATLPVPVTGLAFDRHGFLFASAGEPGKATGSIWRIAENGHARHWVDVDGSTFLNGITPTRDGRALLVVDSLRGAIFRVDAEVPSCALWFEHASLKPNPADPGTPGVNGIKFFGDALHVSNTGHEALWRITLDPHGRAAGVEPWARGQRADDFCFDADGNAYLTTHPYRSVVRLDVDGTRTVIAGPEEGITFSTAAAFGRRDDDRSSIYVTNETLYAPRVGGRPLRPKLVRLDLDVAGHELIDVASRATPTGDPA